MNTPFKFSVLLRDGEGYEVRNIREGNGIGKNEVRVLHLTQPIVERQVKNVTPRPGYCFRLTLEEVREPEEEARNGKV